MTQNPASPTEKTECATCRRPRAQRLCGICQEAICRSCSLQVPADAFSMASAVPDKAKFTDYCPRCFDAEIEPEISKYTELLEKAKQVPFWPKAYRGNIPLLKKGRDVIQIEHGRDRDDVILRLGFKAVELGFNGLLRGEVKSRKVRLQDGYQHMEWSAQALPIHIDELKLENELTGLFE